MKYYSEITGELFDTIEELKNSEEEIQREKEERAKAEEEINKAFNEAMDAWQHYLDVAEKFGRKEAYVPDSIFQELINELFK